jgi:hypothetical protein
METTMNQERERVIVAAWKERGRKEWDPETHGRGLLSLNIQAEVRMTQRGPLGTPIPAHDNLEFRLEQANVNGQTINAIACEGVVVEPPITREESAKKPVPYRSKIAEVRKTRRG